MNLEQICITVLMLRFSAVTKSNREVQQGPGANTKASCDHVQKDDQNSKRLEFHTRLFCAKKVPLIQCNVQNINHPDGVNREIQDQTLKVSKLSMVSGPVFSGRMFCTFAELQMPSYF